MNRISRIVLVGGSLVAIALMTAGCPDLCCNTARGGGSILIADPGGGSHKATFGFQLVCKPTDDPLAPKVSGQFEYQDHAAKDAKGKPMNVSIHGVAKAAGESDPQCTSTQAVFVGDYRPQPESLGAGGRFTVSVEDKGKPGLSDGDTFMLVLEGGVFNGYSSQGTLAGGNIKTF